MSENLIQKMTTLHSRLSPLSKRFGLATYQHEVKIVHRVPPLPGHYVPTERFIDVPIIELKPLPVRLVGTMLGDSLVLSARDLTFSEVNQSIDEKDLHGTWIVDGVRGYTLVHLETKEVTYSGILRSPGEKV